MYKGFKLEVANFPHSEDYQKKGKTLMRHLSHEISPDLKYIVTSDSVLDGNMIMNDWFKQIDADVFISHSHNDRPIALAVAGYLEESLGITCFIDSLIWSKADELLKIIDEKYCRNENSYDYKKRNYSTSHVHNMLLMAITHIIDKTDCLFFLNTPNSMSLKDGIKNQTLSPWIYSEIEISRVIQKTK